MSKKYSKEYIEYLQSEEWKKKRIEKALEQNYTCEICGKVIPCGFNIHHKTYKNLGNEPLQDLMFLCESCHMELHKKKKIKVESKPKKEEIERCANCKYSQIITFTWIKQISFFYCKKLKKECKSACKKYKKGKLKRLPTTNRKKGGNLPKKKGVTKNNGNGSKKKVKR